MMEAASTSETLVNFYQTTRCYNPEDSNLLFEIVDSFMDENSVDWTQCVGVCTDGTRSVSARYGGLQALIRSQAPDALWTHCVIHREALASQYPSPLLNEVVETVIKIVKFIKTRPVKAIFFQQFYIDMGAERTALLYCCNSRWLSRGNVLSHVYELRGELCAYLVEEKHANAEQFTDSHFLIKLAIPL
jgi:hypothetical protein